MRLLDFQLQNSAVVSMTQSSENDSSQAPEVDQGLINMFESLVKTKGLEVANREMSKYFPHLALAIRKAYEKKVGIIASQSGPSTLRGSGLVDWYAGTSDDDRFWPAHRKYLLEKKGWPLATVDSLDAESRGVMKLLRPVGGDINLRGLVVGYVQSGKTANYTALIAKAADVGYRLIIVMAGIHNGLRRQTQIRLQEELIEADESQKPQWHTQTSALEDFRASGSSTDAYLADNSHQRILLVVKKNVHVLGRLVHWLKQAQERLRKSCPALIIDDEADQAGLNTGKNVRSAINAKIVELMQVLPKSAYVGYTATPFANVLIDPTAPEDLYPKDFIVALSKPKGYFGTELFFGREPLENEDAQMPQPPDMFRPVETKEIPKLRPANRSEVDTFVAGMPPSLRTAIGYFFLATAARWTRGHRRKHSSMLVHTALYPDVHRKLSTVIDNEVSRLTKHLGSSSIREELRQIWASESSRVVVDGLKPVPFDALEVHLADVLKQTQIIIDNGESESRLLYKEERQLKDDDKVNHIAVGGNTLSRGLTLEGLVVSYFVRGASTYDTLLQMGRWFGYRFGYQDLPRLWMTAELQDDFFQLATVEEEVRRDIARYEEEGITPLEFAVRIRCHPTLAITSRMKMQHAIKVGIDYSGFTRQTTVFRHRDQAWLNGNWEAGGRLLDRLIEERGLPEPAGPHRFYRNVPVAEVRRFITEYQFHESLTELQTQLLEKYLEAQAKKGRCLTWTVAVVSRVAEDKDLGQASLGIRHAPFNLVNRALGREKNSETADLGTITTQENFGFDLGPDARTRAVDSESKTQPKRPAGTDPLLLLYLISKDSYSRDPDTKKRKTSEGKDLAAAANILGVALAFPSSPSGSGEGLRREHRNGIEYISVSLPQPDSVDEVDVAIDEDDG